MNREELTLIFIDHAPLLIGLAFALFAGLVYKLAMNGKSRQK